MSVSETLRELRALIEDDDSDLQDALVEALRHPSRQVRTFAALNLAELFQDVRAAAHLAEALQEGDAQAQRAAANALWEIGDADAAGLLREIRSAPIDRIDVIANALFWIGWSPDDPNSAVVYYVMTQQWQACIALGSEAVSGLLEALQDWDGGVRRGAAWALGEIGDPQAVPELIERLEDFEGGLFGVGDRICDIAAEALAKIGTPEAWDALDWWYATYS
jgi:HEAT repeat protein